MVTRTRRIASLTTSALMVMIAVTTLALAEMPATATAATTTSTEHFTLVGNGDTGTVLAYGAFNAQGTNTKVHKTGRTGEGVLKFPQGSIAVIHTDDRGTTTKFDKQTCSAQSRATGDFLMKNGTGAYRGITGHGEYTTQVTAIFAHTATGCGNAVIGQLVITEANGPVSLPS